eukprot:324927_1
MNLRIIYILLYLMHLSVSDDPQCLDSEYIGFYFNPPFVPGVDSFSPYGLSKLRNISFNIQINCNKYNFTTIPLPPIMYLSITNSTPTLDPYLIQDLFAVADIKQMSLEDPIPKQVWIQNITRWIDDVWPSYFTNITRLSNDTDFILQEWDLPNWRHIWMLTADMEPIIDLCNTTIQSTAFTTQLTFSWPDQYTRLFPVFEDKAISHNQTWMDEDSNVPLETIWNAHADAPPMYMMNDTIYYNMVLLNDGDTDWLECFITRTNEEDNAYAITSYHFEKEAENVSYVDAWDYTLTSEPYIPLITYDNCGTEFDSETEDEVCPPELC